MALARNLNRKKRLISLPKISKPNKRFYLVIILLAIAVIFVSSAFILPKIITDKKNKTELKYETGDRPLAQKMTIWVTADGGLFLRERADAKSKALSLIPKGTQLTAEEIVGDWYKVIYQEKTGWVNKSYVTTQAPPEDPTKGWKNYQNNQAGYSLRYPADWVSQDYGVNPATESQSYVAFGQQLGPTLDSTTLPPIVIRYTTKALSDIEASYASKSGVLAEAATVAGIAGKKYIYNSSSGVQMTSFVVQKGAGVYIMEESGGYADELSLIVGTIIFTS